MTHESFKECLEDALRLKAILPEIAQAFGRKLSLGEKMLAVINKGARLGTLNEDFVLGPVPASMTLYEPVNLIEVAKEFYGQRGLRQVHLSVMCKGSEEILSLEGERLGGMVQYDLGRGYRTDGQWELWVTTMFGPREKH